MKRFASLALGPVFLIGAIIFGGASSAGAYANAALQIAAALVIAGFLLSPTHRPTDDARRLLTILLAGVGLAIVQLVPLPPLVWTNLPGRQIVVDSYVLAGMVPGWRPLSLTPDATVGAGLAMLPVIAAALIGMYATRRALIAMFIAIMVAMAAAVVLGLAQRATGLDSSFYLYAITNRGYAVGFFANSNHLATLCALAIPMATALVVAPRRVRPMVRWLVLIAVFPFALLGIAFSASLAGVGLGVIGALASYGIAGPRRAVDKISYAPAAAIGLALVVGVILLLWIYGGTSVVGPGDELGRAALWQRTVRAIGATMPFGSGLGSFSAVYPQFEDAMTVTGVFANHAHNDYLETVLTAGVPGILMMLWFARWWVRRAIGIWGGPAHNVPARNVLAQAAIVATFLIIVHELVDYPLRTAAIGVIFGLCCGVMARPDRADAPAPPSRRAARHLSA